MSTKCSTCSGQDVVSHTNAFVNLNGIPYLVAEYLDRRAFQQIDRSAVQSEIFIDQSDCMRTIIDISIDDIGQKATGGLNVIGNTTKRKNLIELIKSNFRLLNHQLPVLKRGIVIKVNYQLENKRTGQVLRSLVEDLRISDRSYFIDINSGDINDNAVVVNFSNSMVSTVNEFTHGADPMVLRISSINMFYERVKPNPMEPRFRQSMTNDPEMMRYFYGCDADLYKYHQEFQHHHNISSEYGNECVDDALPPSWAAFNRFYHFDETAKDMIIHDQEVYDRRTKIMLVPCGTVQVNRAFMVNPGSRLIFKFCIWKNDITVVSNCNDIAAALQAPYYPCNCGCDPQPDTSETPSNNDCHCGPRPSIPNQNTEMDYEQNAAINQLNSAITALMGIVKGLHPDTPAETPTVPALPEEPKPQRPCHPHHKPGMKEIFDKLDSLQEAIDDLAFKDCDCEDVAPIPTDWISDAVGNL